MKRILLLLLVVFYIAPVMAFTHSAGLDYDNACNFKESFPVKAGNAVYFHSELDVGDLITIKTTVNNPAAKAKEDEHHRKYYWHFINHNRKSFKREYGKIFTTKIRIGAKPGWFEFKYKRFDIPEGNKVTFQIIDTTYCKKVVAFSEKNVHK